MYRSVLILAMLAQSLTSLAQSESGLLLEAEAEKKLSKKFSVALEADMRTRNDFKTMDRWSVGIGGEYKPMKHLKLGAGYTLLNSNFREDISFNATGTPKKWRPSYWGIRHRFNISATGSYKFSNNLRISLRERWQYTYRPEKTVQRFNFNEDKWASIRLIFAPSHSIGIMDVVSEIFLFCSSLVKSETVLPSSTDPIRFVRPAR